MSIANDGNRRGKEGTIARLDGSLLGMHVISPPPPGEKADQGLPESTENVVKGSTVSGNAFMYDSLALQKLAQNNEKMKQYSPDMI